MINPAEEIVNIWLQDHHKHFIMNNIVVPKETRLNIKGRKIGGGRGKEIDFISTDGKDNYYWIEVSVSPNPRLSGGAEKARTALVDDVAKKFAKEKETWLKNNFGIKTPKKWFIYSPNLFSFFSKKIKVDEEKQFCDNLRKLGIITHSFKDVLKDVFNELNHFGYDSTRQYIFLLKKMGYKSVE